MSTFEEQAALSHLGICRKSCQEGNSVEEVSGKSNCKRAWHLLRKWDGPDRTPESKRSTGLFDLHTLNADLENK